MKKRIIILGTLVLLIILGWAGGWYFVAGQIRTQVDNLALADGETTPRLTCEDLTVGGFPFRFDLQCAGAAIVASDLLVELPEWRASVMAYRPNHILASAMGPAAVSDAFTGVRQTINWSSIEASLRVEDWRIARLSLVGDDLSWADTLFGETLIARSPHVEFHLLDMPELHNADTARAALALFARADAMEAPGLEITPTQLEIEAEMTGLRDDLRNWGALPFLQDWQRAGGKLRLVGLRASDAGSDLTAQGELGLDGQGYVTGAITIDSLGVAERIGPFIDDPWRTLVLGVPGEGGRHRNQLNFAAGGMSSGLVPIAAVPALF